MPLPLLQQEARQSAPVRPFAPLQVSRVSEIPLKKILDRADRLRWRVPTDVLEIQSSRDFGNRCGFLYVHLRIVRRWVAVNASARRKTGGVRKIAGAAPRYHSPKRVGV